MVVLPRITLDMFMTAGLGVLALMAGMFFTRRIPALKRLCIPVPVSGGLAVSLIALLCHLVWGVDFIYDGSVKDLCMMLFFTSVGFQSDFSLLKKGGKPLLVMIALVALLIVSQNFLALGLAGALGLDPLVGMASGSIPMCGGHGTAGGFSPLLEQMGLGNSSSITMAAATFGLVAGSLIGGPLGELLVRKHRLAQEGESGEEVRSVEATEAAEEKRGANPHSEEKSFRRYTQALCQLFFAMAGGMLVSKLLALSGITFPTYFGALLVAALIRNIPGATRKILCVGEVVSIGNICLLLFLGMAMATLKLWELSGLVLPLLLILLCQGVFMIIYAWLLAFRVLGRDYDAAVLVSGLCGFGLGATPNAMANMSAVCYKYR
ncbi:MAG: hypothetical protein J5764_04700 [Bacteroidales bacterium]|nr:hypothetical protein [Bacteroidales bacterium]